MEQNKTDLMLTEESKVTIHPSFSINECTFLSEGRGVIYSPFIGETLLCEPSVIDYLVQLTVEPDMSFKQLLKTHPAKAKNVIQQLAELHIIEIQS